MLRNTTDSWGSVAKAFHWIIALMVIMQLAAGMIMAGLTPTPVKMKLYDLHKSTGTLIFGLVLLRLMWRLSSVLPVQVSTLKPYHHYLEKAGFTALYIFMIIMPASGFIMSDAGGRPVTLYHIFTLPPLFPKNADIAKNARQVHHFASYGFTAILVLHVLAALYHHYILKNTILKRMLPSKKYCGQETRYP